MKLVLLLLPNLYDIFTLMMIGYAFVLHQKGELQIPFAVACGLIYVATRLGIFAGKLLHKILGQPQAVAAAEGAAPDPKMAVWNFGPQVAFVVIFQLIMALCCLPHSTAVAKVPTNQLQMQEQNQVETPNSEVVSSNAVNTDETAAKAEESVAKSEQKQEQAKNATSDVDKWLSEGEEEVTKPQQKKEEVKKAAKTTSTRRAATKKVKTNNTVAAQTYVDSSYEVPDRTLKSVGVSIPAETSTNYRSSNQIAAANGTYNVSGLTPKRYPGDDNPINTTWGYYKQTPQQQNQSVRQSNSAQTGKSGAHIPANTLRSIGY